MKEIYSARIDELKLRRDQMQADMTALIGELAENRDEETRAGIIQARARMAAEVDALTDEIEEIRRIDVGERVATVDAELAPAVEQLLVLARRRLEARQTLNDLFAQRLRVYNSRKPGSAMEAARLKGEIAVQQAEAAQLEREYTALTFHLDQLDRQRAEILGRPAPQKKESSVGRALRQVNEETRVIVEERRRTLAETKSVCQQAATAEQEKKKKVAVAEQGKQKRADEAARAERRRAYAESLHN